MKCMRWDYLFKTINAKCVDLNSTGNLNLFQQYLELKYLSFPEKKSYFSPPLWYKQSYRKGNQHLAAVELQVP